MNKLRLILKTSLSRGLSKRELALAVALGFTLGLFPVLGATSLLCLGAAGLLGLNLPVLQAVNWIAAPVQLLLIVPFMKTGAALLGLDATLLTIERLSRLPQMGIFESFGDLGVLLLAGILAWLLISVPVAALVYALTSGLLRLLGGAWRRVPGAEPGM